MRFAVPFALLASPAFAHNGAHLHPHGVEGWVVGLGLLVLIGGAIAVRVRQGPRK